MLYVCKVTRRMYEYAKDGKGRNRVGLALFFWSIDQYQISLLSIIDLRGVNSLALSSFIPLFLLPEMCMIGKMKAFVLSETICDLRLFFMKTLIRWEEEGHDRKKDEKEGIQLYILSFCVFLLCGWKKKLIFSLQL
jgi:hypothetical protein